MLTLRKLFMAAAIFAVAAGSASAHGTFHGGGGGSGRGFDGGHGDRSGEFGYHRYNNWDYGYYALPYGGETYCGYGYHIGSDGRCWPDKH